MDNILFRMIAIDSQNGGTVVEDHLDKSPSIVVDLIYDPMQEDEAIEDPSIYIRSMIDLVETSCERLSWWSSIGGTKEVDYDMDNAILVEDYAIDNGLAVEDHKIGHSQATRANIIKTQSM